MRPPSKPQAYAPALAIYRGSGTLRGIDHDDTIVDATVAALRRNGWAENVRFYDDDREWRWHWFTVTNAARALPSVITEVARMKAYDDDRGRKWIAEDDEGGPS